MLLFCCAKLLQVTKSQAGFLARPKLQSIQVAHKKRHGYLNKNNCIYTQHKKYDNMRSKAMLNEIK